MEKIILDIARALAYIIAFYYYWKEDYAQATFFLVIALAK